MPGEVKLGTASWTDKPLIEAGTFYPLEARTPEARLRYYASRFPLVEADTTYYGLPTEQLTRSWVQRTPEGFTFDVKGLLLVEATVLKTQQTFSLLIEGNPGLLTDAEIKERLQTLSELKIHPRDHIENRTLLARGERVYQQLRGDMREWLGMRIVEFERALATQDKRLIATAQRQFKEQLEHIERDSHLAD